MPTSGEYDPPVVVPAVRRIFAGTGVSDAAGNVVFTFTPAFRRFSKKASALFFVKPMVKIRIQKLRPRRGGISRHPGLLAL